MNPYLYDPSNAHRMAAFGLPVRSGRPATVPRGLSFAKGPQARTARAWLYGWSRAVAARVHGLRRARTAGIGGVTCGAVAAAAVCCGPAPCCA